MDVENEKMYGCTMVVGPVTFVSFGGLSVHVGSTLASGTQKKSTSNMWLNVQYINLTYISIIYIYIFT